MHATIAGVLLGLLTPARAATGEAKAPVDDLIHRLHPWVAYVIMPVIALCNAGVALDASSFGDALGQRVALGLLAGTPIGITLFARLAARTRIAELPRGVDWFQIVGAGFLAGIGFTVALFIAALAFDDATLVAGAKIGILAASLLAAVLGAPVSASSSAQRHWNTPRVWPGCSVNIVTGPSCRSKFAGTSKPPAAPRSSTPAVMPNGGVNWRRSRTSFVHGLAFVKRSDVIPTLSPSTYADWLISTSQPRLGFGRVGTTPIAEIPKSRSKLVSTAPVVQSNRWISIRA